jgi:hypothetical protein
MLRNRFEVISRHNQRKPLGPVPRGVFAELVVAEKGGVEDNTSSQLAATSAAFFRRSLRDPVMRVPYDLVAVFIGLTVGRTRVVVTKVKGGSCTDFGQGQHVWAEFPLAVRSLPSS